MTKVLGFLFLIIGGGLYRSYVDNGGILGSAIVGGLSAFIGAVIGGVIDAWIAKRKEPNGIVNEVSATTDGPIVLQAEKTTPYYYGFGGWLYLFSAGLVYQFFIFLKSAYDNYLIINTEDFKALTNFDSEYYNSFLYPTMIFETIGSSLFALLIIFLGYFCIKQKKLFKKLSIAFIVTSFIFCAIDLFLLLTIQNDFPEQIVDDTSYSGIYRATVYLAIWLPYFLLSKRIRNTFTH